MSLAQHGTTLPYLRLIAIRHFADKLVRTDSSARLHNLLMCCVKLSVTDIILNISRENKAVLHHNTHLLTQGMNGHLRDILSIDQDATAIDIVKP